EGWDPSRNVTKQLSDPTSVLVVVNKTRPLSPATYAPSDLVPVSGVPGGSTQRMRREAATALATMYKAASAEGLSFSVASSYRSYATQKSLFNSYAANYGVARAETFSARPSYSEHQTGWTADLSDGAGCRISKCFGDTTVGKWVAQNGHKYGFVIRYPAGKTSVTGYIYEPWHVRYVGESLATYMHDNGVKTLEEQFDLPSAPRYS
ncbi:M15 family metallopeptidase, partial [Demequina aurantiaca]|uniref:M15 family metallopeptidase n=1 Tax=Demequina aurantiaca TaxID=676200 RepID=UPI0007863D7E